MSTKYPRTAHLPWSPGGAPDDRRLDNIDHLLEMPLVMTEQMDGSNLCLSREGVFARTLAHAPVCPSLDVAKAEWSALAGRLPILVSLFAEWMYDRHSIAYSALPGYLLVFGAREDQTGTWLSWDRTRALASELALPTVPELWTGILRDERELHSLIQDLGAKTSSYGAAAREGVIVRWSGAFPVFDRAVAKWVHSDHVPTDDQRARQVIARNGLS